MFFIERTLYERLTHNGLEVDPRACGIGRVGERTGMLINADALTLDQLNAVAPFLYGPGRRFEIEFTPEGFWVVAPSAVHPDEEDVPVAAEEDWDAEPVPQSDDAPGPDATPEPQGAAAMAPAFQAVAPPQNGHVATAAMAAARLVARVQHRIDRPIRVVERDTLTFVRGLPEVEDGTLTVAINAVPGSGPLPALDSWPTARIDEVTRELTTYVASVPPADVPAGMAPLTVNHVLVGCYDDRLMALFVDHVAIAAFAIPAWLQNFERPAETLVDPDSAAQALARAARQNAGDTGQAVARTREDVANRRTQLEDLRQEIAAYEAELARQPAPDPMAALEEQLHRIQAAGVWSPVSDINRDLRFQLSHREVVDPRDGRRRRLPHTLDVSLRGWCVGLGPFAQHRNTTTNPDQHHPRIFGGHLLQPELEQAVQEAARNGDFEGGLALIHDVLTNFTADDPDVAALDGWPVV